MDNVMDNEFFVPAALWLSGANLIVAFSLKRQGLSYKYMLTPVVISKLQRQDWGLNGVTVPCRFAVEALYSK